MKSNERFKKMEKSELMKWEGSRLQNYEAISWAVMGRDSLNWERKAEGWREILNWNGEKLRKQVYIEWPQCRIFSINAYSVQFSRSVMSNSLRPHESQHARPRCPSPTPGVHTNSCPLSRWCHPAISSSVVPFSSCPNPSQHHSLFQWINSSHEVAKVLEFQL